MKKDKQRTPATGAVATSSSQTNPSSGQKGVNPSRMKQRLYAVILFVSLFVAVAAVLFSLAPSLWWEAVEQTAQFWSSQPKTNLPADRSTLTVESEYASRKEDVGEISQPQLTRPDASSTGGQRNTGAELRCYTLEAYSDVFLSKRPGQSRRRLFQCGVRVSDLRTENRDEYHSACAATRTSAGDSVYPSLRIVLTEKEEAWHKQWRSNAATQQIPLSRVNDDYCDCMDGSDELLTNACSMVAGSGMPLGVTRWRSYLVANKDTQVYEDAAPLKDDAERRHRQAYHTQGPVLPIPCLEDPTVLLSPSLVADGLVDCTDGSDETEAAWQSSSFGSGTRGTHTPEEEEEEEAVAHGSDAEARRRSSKRSLAARREEAAARVKAWRDAVSHATRREWQDRLASTQALRAGAWATPSTVYTSALNPHYVSTRALLVDTGFLSLFTTEEVLRARVEMLEVLHGIATKGHVVYKNRVAHGWDKLGKKITDKRMDAAVELANITGRYNMLRQHVINEVQKKGVETPDEAGVDHAILIELEQLEFIKREKENAIEYHDIITQQRLFGDFYEYYPLYNKALSFPVSDVIAPYRKSQQGRRALRATKMSPEQAIIAQQMELHRRASQGENLALASEAAAHVLHVDNIAVDLVGTHYGQHLLWRQAFSLEADGEAVARRSGKLPPGTPYDPSIFESKPGESPFLRVPSYVVGHWMPYSVQKNAALLSMTDPAGDAALPRRLMVRPATPLLRGSGTLQWPHRQTPKVRFLTISPDESREQNTAQRLRKEQRQAADDAAESEKPQPVKIPLFYHQSTPDHVAMHIFRGGSLNCGPDPSAAVASAQSGSQTPRQYTWGGLVAVCDTADRILSWALDGRCIQEVVVGTPSACTGWVLQATKAQLVNATRQLEQLERSQ